MSSAGGPTLDRRDLVKVAVGGVTGLAACATALEPPEGSQEESTETATSSPSPTEEIYSSEIQEEAANYIEENYAEYESYLEDFVSDERIPDEFVDQQLEFWLDLPETGPENREGDEWDLKYQVLEREWLDHDDWTQTGNPHIFPTGEVNEEGHHYDHTEEEGYDGDAFMPRWYNEKATVFDVRKSGESPEEWVYLGPKDEPLEEEMGVPERDRVGKKGPKTHYKGVQFISEEEAAKWRISSYLEEDVGVEDLVGSRITVVWYDYMVKDGKPVAKPSSAVWKLVEKYFDNAPVKNKDGSKGIDNYRIKGREKEYEEVMQYEEAAKFGEKSLPDKLKGTTEYALFMDKIKYKDEDPFSAAISTAIGVSPGGFIQGMDKKERNNVWAKAGLIIHELYRHGFGLGHKTEQEWDKTRGKERQLTDEEWITVVKGMKPTGKRRSVERGWVGFYTGLRPSYPDPDPGSILKSDN